MAGCFAGIGDGKYKYFNLISMGTNYFICPNCPDGNGKYQRTHHVEISNAEASAFCGDTSTSRKILGTIGFIADKTNLGANSNPCNGNENLKMHRVRYEQRTNA